MNDNPLLIEERIINAVKAMLSGKANELLGELPFLVPPIVFGNKPNQSHYDAIPEIRLSTCERTEKDRMVRQDAYHVSIAFVIPGSGFLGNGLQGSLGERNAYAYAAAVDG